MASFTVMMRSFYDAYVIINCMKLVDFAKGTERLVNPISVGKVHYMQGWLKRLPKSLQRKIVTSSAKKSSKMGFVVEPYAFFLFYEMPDPEKVNPLLPSGFRVAKSRVFDGDEERYYGIVSIFRVHTSAFWGARSEFYAIAENEQTGLLSWIILDYVSDTISYDHKNGLRSAEATKAIITTTCDGKFLADIMNTEDGRRIACSTSLKNVQDKPLDERLWIEGNTSIAYGQELADETGGLFSLTFLPEEMSSAWEVPVADVEVEAMSWFPEVFGGELKQAACFPYAQHMLSDSPGTSTHYGSKEALRQAAEAVDFSGLKGFGEK